MNIQEVLPVPQSCPGSFCLSKPSIGICIMPQLYLGKIPHLAINNLLCGPKNRPNFQFPTAKGDNKLQFSITTY